MLEEVSIIKGLQINLIDYFSSLDIDYMGVHNNVVKLESYHESKIVES